ncbi:hypothetical protein YYC_05307 [Plasmodium yoelii 17X]|uniref:Uncharacterized protein n=1 Tax=Plasmodium yoelii 17X TaxID=1323249 RepID=V7PC06_PLAYE|nr:hypothetical protein YYC_05307 [Plasmodium yoelii 17X]
MEKKKKKKKKLNLNIDDFFDEFDLNDEENAPSVEADDQNVEADDQNVEADDQNVEADAWMQLYNIFDRMMLLNRIKKEEKCSKC